MRGKGFHWIEGLVAVALMLLAISVLWLLVPAMTSEAAAAWVQAIGSIVAIIAALLIPMYQHRQAEKAADDARALSTIVLLKSIQHLVVAAQVHVRAAHDAFCSGSKDILLNYFVARYIKGDLEDIAEALGQIPLHGVPAEIFGLVSLKRVLVRLEEYLAYFAMGNYTDENYRNMVERVKKDLSFIISINASLSEEMLREGTRVRDHERVIELFEDPQSIASSRD